MRRLVCHGASVAAPHACGRFFYRTPQLYYGGTVLGVAACTDGDEIVEYLLGELAREHGDATGAALSELIDRGPDADLRVRGGVPAHVPSMVGNSVLHCVVAHDRVEMLHHLVRRHGFRLDVTNANGLDVLAWAALVGSPAVVVAALRLGARCMWQWGVLECNAYDADSLLRALVLQDGQSGRLGRAIAGHHGLIRLHLEARGCPPHS